MQGYVCSQMDLSDAFCLCCRKLQLFAKCSPLLSKEDGSLGHKETFTADGYCFTNSQENSMGRPQDTAVYTFTWGTSGVLPEQLPVFRKDAEASSY